jgi:hypothetical protein
MRKFTFESVYGDDRVMLSLRETSISETINKFFGFLRAAGYDDEIIKSCTRDILDGKWSNSLGTIIGTNSGLQISPLTITNLTTANLTSYNTNQLMSLEQYNQVVKI